ncbi:MAG: ComEC/Rec2 family competence protein, partial [Candidatus Colwellbacteria bacterium]|nr:ComEC/Rec2 family competence protein [Candidatus Colwellbacteria bacterium]
HASLASGLLLGERAEFTDEFEQAMRNSGTTHIVALSGYNIAILVLVISGIFSYLWDRRVAFYLSLLIVPGFVVMTGAAPSVIRAGVMGLILLLAENQSRPYSPRNAIVLTALGMILLNPRIGVDDVGFQLSFAALVGIIYLYPLLERKFNIQNEGFLSWKKNALQTASAQIAVLPIILSTFGFFSPVALISNVLILEFIPVTMLLAFVTTILGFISFHLSLIAGWVSSVFLSYEIFIIKFFGLSWF